MLNLNWRQVALLRACCKYCCKPVFRFSQTYMEQTLAAWPLVARLLVAYFETRFDPDRASWSKSRSALCLEATRNPMPNAE